MTELFTCEFLARASSNTSSRSSSLNSLLSITVFKISFPILSLGASAPPLIGEFWLDLETSLYISVGLGGLRVFLMNLVFSFSLLASFLLLNRMTGLLRGSQVFFFRSSGYLGITEEYSQILLCMFSMFFLCPCKLSRNLIFLCLLILEVNFMLSGSMQSTLVPGMCFSLS